MPNLSTWRSKATTMPTQPQNDNADAVIEAIAQQLKLQHDKGVITSSQLTKILTLATSTEQLKFVLTML